VALIRRRHVIYGEGYDPQGAEGYYRLFSRSFGRFLKNWPIESKIGDLQIDSDDFAREKLGRSEKVGLIDEARMSVTVTAPRDWTVISNGAETARVEVGEALSRWEFAETEPFSTYLVGIVAGVLGDDEGRGAARRVP
jgi:hypothetical protein